MSYQPFIYPYITKTKLQIRVSFLKERYGKRGRSISEEKEFDENGEWQRKEKALKDSLRRAKVSVVDLSLNNEFTHFGTLTINSAWHNIDTAEEQVKVLDKLLKALDNYRARESEDFRYIVCPEYGEKEGRLHFHFLAKGIAKDDLYINHHKKLDWKFMNERFGFVQITKIGDTDNDHRRVAFYCSKYITKDNLQLRSHRYFASKDLRRPERFCMDDEDYTISMQEWLKFMGFEPYYDNKEKHARCYSIPARVFWDMMDYIGVYNNRKCLLYEGFRSFYARNPFQKENTSPYVSPSALAPRQLTIGI